MLHSLQHPCIVSLVGISIHPLCFALQLAPLGSLNTVLEERHKGKGMSEMFFPPDSGLKVLLFMPAEHEVVFCLDRLQVHAPWSHANLQSGLSDCSRTGVPSQEEHHLL